MFRSSSAKVKALKMTQMFIKLSADSSCDIFTGLQNHSAIISPPEQQDTILAAGYSRFCAARVFMRVVMHS